MMDNEIIFSMPAWARYFLITVVSAMALGFLLLAVTYSSWAGDSSLWLKYFFYTISFFALVSAYRLTSWKQMVYFKTSNQGVFVPCPKLQKYDSDYFFISWNDIKNIRLKKFVGSSGVVNGVSVDVRVALKDKSQFFPELMLAEHTEWVSIGFTDAFLKKKKAIAELNRLKSQAV